MQYVALFCLALALSSCTLSFQNVDTHGTATDLIDENLETSPQTDLSIPVAK